jgi:hypothetical protein
MQEAKCRTHRQNLVDVTALLKELKVVNFCDLLQTCKNAENSSSVETYGSVSLTTQ